MTSNLRSLFISDETLFQSFHLQAGEPTVVSSPDADDDSSPSPNDDADDHNRKKNDRWYYASTNLLHHQYHVDVVDSTTLEGKIVTGYQGWFSAPSDGGRNAWHHWFRPHDRDQGSPRVAMWPDLGEYGEEELFPTRLRYPDDTTVRLYSSHRPETVDRHVRWMRDYGIDGAFVQRFVSEITSSDRLRGVRDNVLINVRRGAEKYGRIYANMYDVSGANESTLVENIKRDWMHLVDGLRITESSRYLHHHRIDQGRDLPVVAIWGFGANNRPGTPAQLLELIRWFRTTPILRHRAVVVGGVLPNWRDQGGRPRRSLRKARHRSSTKVNGSHNNNNQNNHNTGNNNENGKVTWYEAYRELDVISPWTVGRIKDLPGVEQHREEYWEPDMEECDQHNIDYLPVVYPGFSYHNHDRHHKPFNEVPRLEGRLYWHQLHHAVASGAKMVYVAMFDEVDEGTAIYKLAETKDRTPACGQDFVALDQDQTAKSEKDGKGKTRGVVPCDWYLTLTGEATKYLRSGDGIPNTMPDLPLHGCRRR